jgi:hypothetical protein
VKENEDVKEHPYQENEPHVKENEDDRQRRLHEEITRIRPAWSKNEKGSVDTAQRVGYTLVGLAVTVISWQLVVRVFGVSPQWAPSELIKSLKDLCVPYVKSTATTLANVFNLWKWSTALLRRLRPVVEEMRKLNTAWMEVVIACAIAVKDGVIEASDGYSHTLIVGIVSLLLVFVLLVTVEVVGMSWMDMLRPSFWMASVSNAFYIVAGMATSVYSWMFRVVVRFTETIELLLRRFPMLYRLFSRTIAAGRFLVLGTRDLLVSVPYGIHKGIASLSEYTRFPAGEVYALGAVFLGLSGLIYTHGQLFEFVSNTRYLLSSQPPFISAVFIGNVGLCLLIWFICCPRC